MSGREAGLGRRPGSLRRAILLGSVPAALTGALIVLVDGILATTSGLVVVAGIGGALVGLAVRYGAGTSMRRSTKLRLAVLVASAGVGAGYAGTWLVALAQGGVLGPVDLLAETLGPQAILLPLVAIVAALLVA